MHASQRAGTLADVFTLAVGEEAPVAFRAYDGSVAGRADATTVLEARSPKAVRYLLGAPGQLGLARAYVTGALEVHGDLYAALRGLHAHRRRAVRVREAAGVVARAAWSARERAPAPAEEAPPRWRRGLAVHTRRRDASSIAHHYDVSNTFYALVLGPTMAYSCAVFSTPQDTLEEAQAEKFDLICRKLDLRPGMRLLDVGAGWGGMVLHAATHYGVRAVGVTISRAQAQWAQERIAAAGLARRAEVRLLDYRDLGSEAFDAISSIGAMEHFGTKELASYFAAMAARLRPGGRMLNHCITRPSNHDRHRAGPFIDRYIFPDGELQGPSTVVGAMHDNGFEVRHTESLREHYAITLSRWSANLDARWADAVAEVGERRARAWRLYLACARLSFDLGHVQVHQFLGVRRERDGRSGMPLRPDWEGARGQAARELVSPGGSLLGGDRQQP
jgi:cyclopropane-fatty-acyl-phospholipid synthase